MPNVCEQQHKTQSAFSKKKSRILASLSQADYSDKSPKGSVDADIVDLIEEINAVPGWVTTSSCAGRVSVFVEGRKGGATVAYTNGDVEIDINQNVEAEIDRNGIPTTSISTSTIKPSSGVKGNVNTSAGPGGKGHGNKWLYVSHSPVPAENLSGPSETALHDLFQLVPRSIDTSLSWGLSSSNFNVTDINNTRLIKLSFSPLILHILCADLHAAKPLLAAAINAGFRESGVQSLKILGSDADETGVMVAIRTAGVGFESVVGFVDDCVQEVDGDSGELCRSCVDEGYLRMCVGVVNARFGWNEERRERLRSELRKVSGVGATSSAKTVKEDEGIRRERKRREGLRRKMELELKIEADREERTGDIDDEEDVLDGGLGLDST